LKKEFKFEPPQKSGYDAVEALHAMFDGDVKVFFAISGNFLSNVPDTVYSAHAMQRCKLTVHVSTKLNRSHLITGERALILPCLGRSEADLQESGKQFLTVEDSMGIIDPSEGFRPPASPELMSDVAIIAKLAGFGERLQPDPRRNFPGHPRIRKLQRAPGEREIFLSAQRRQAPHFQNKFWQGQT
jgi:anaerobic selenocysteine-containing dehydrogenase